MSDKFKVGDVIVRDYGNAKSVEPLVLLRITGSNNVGDKVWLVEYYKPEYKKLGTMELFGEDYFVMYDLYNTPLYKALREPKD